MIKEHSWVTFLGQKAFVRQYQGHGYFEICVMNDTNDDYRKLIVSYHDIQELETIKLIENKQYLFIGETSLRGRISKGDIVTLEIPETYDIYSCIIYADMKQDRATPFDLQPINY